MSASARDAPGGEVPPLRPLPKSSEAWHLLVALADKGIKVRCKGGRLLVHKSEYQRLSTTETQALHRLRGELVALLEPAAEVLAPARRAAPEEPFGLSASQRRMWNIEKVLGFGSPRLKAALILRGELDAAALDRSFGRLLERHSVLRTCVREHGGDVLQTLLPETGFHLERFDVSGLPEDERWSACERLRTEFFAAALTLETGVVFRAGLIRVEERVSCLMAVVHHLCADASSMQLIYRDLVELYREEVRPGEASGREQTPAHQYFEFVEWEQRQAGAGENRLKAFWSSAVNVHYGWRELRDPAASAEPPVPARRTSVVVPPAQTTRLRQLARECAATLNAVLLALTAKLADRHFVSVDARAERGVNIGMPVTGRTVPQFEHTVGFFANTVILSLELGPEGATMEPLVRSCQERLMSTLLHQGLPFQDLFKVVAAPDGNRVYQISFNMMPRSRPQEPLPGLAVDEWRTEEVSPGYFDLRIDVVEQDETLTVYFTHLLAKLSGPYVDALASDFSRLVDLACDRGAA